jgi:hypothetical protein
MVNPNTQNATIIELWQLLTSTGMQFRLTILYVIYKEILLKNAAPFLLWHTGQRTERKTGFLCVGNRTIFSVSNQE